MFFKSVLKTLLIKLSLAILIVSNSIILVPAASAEDFNGITYIVNSSTDEKDAQLGDGNCATHDGNCTLRAAIQESKLDNNESLILFTVPEVELSEELPILDHSQKLFIHGSNTIIDANSNGRFFSVAKGADVEVKSINFKNASNFEQEEFADYDSGGSISVWVNPHSDGENGFARILDKANKSKKGWILRADSQSNNKLRVSFFQFFDDEVIQWSTTNQELELNQWNHLLISYNNISSENNPTFFVNNVEVNIEKVISTNGTASSDAGNNLFIGNRANDDNTFDGGIDEVAFFDRILTQEEVTYLSNNPVNDDIEDIVAHWTMNDGFVDTVGDNINGNDGLITNAPLINGKFGLALEFNGQSGNVEVQDHPTIQDIFDAEEAPAPTTSPQQTLWGGAINNNGNLVLDAVKISEGNNLIDTSTWDSSTSLCLCGGVIRNSANLTIKDSEISNNQSTIKLKAGLQGMQAKGGVICNNGNGELTLDNTTVQDNHIIVESHQGVAEQFSVLGAAIASYSSFESIDYANGTGVGQKTLTKLNILNSSRILNNSVTFNGDIKKSFAWGAGIYNNGSLTINSAQIDSNEINYTITTEHCACTRIDALGAGVYSRDSGVVWVDENYDGEFTEVTVANGHGVSIKNSSISSNSINIDANVDKAFASAGGLLLSHFHSETLEPLEGLTINNNEINATLKDAELLRIEGAGLKVGIEQTVKDSSTFLRNSTINGNSLNSIGNNTPYIESQGAGISTANKLTINSSTISNNHAKETNSKGGAKGGAIYNHQEVNLLNSTISGNKVGSAEKEYNTTARGAAIFSATSHSKTNIVSSTITDNHTLKQEAPDEITSLVGEDNFKNYALYSNGEFTARNSILANNDATTKNCHHVTNLVSGGHNIIDDFSCFDEVDTGDTDLENVDPLLEALADNGGGTKTHALKAESPAMDRIPLELCTDLDNNSLTVDQRAEARPMPEGGICDIGSYESPIGNPDNINAAFEDNLPEVFSTVVSFENTHMGKIEGDFTVKVKVKLSEESEDTVKVDVKLNEAETTATKGEDFTFEDETLVFLPGELEKEATLQILNDYEIEEKNPIHERVILYLYNVENAEIDDFHDRFTWSIVDNDPEEIVEEEAQTAGTEDEIDEVNVEESTNDVTETPVEEETTEEVEKSEDPVVNEDPVSEQNEETNERFEMFFSKLHELGISIDRATYAELQELLKRTEDPEEFLKALEGLFRENSVRITRDQWQKLEEFVNEVAGEDMHEAREVRTETRTETRSRR